MTRKLQIGDKVICRYWNIPDKRFYGKEFEGEIVAIHDFEIPNYTPKHDFVVWVKGDSPRGFITVWRKEIIRRVK